MTSTILTTRTAERHTKQERAIVTRKKLIASARLIFARDGFEQASLEEIASHAGKTRGAFYDNFQNKEDIFFAIFEEDLDLEQSAIRAALRKVDTLEGRLDLLAECLTAFISNRERTLLYMEFKTHAIRSTTHRKRLADLHAIMRMSCSLPEIDEVLPELARQSESSKRELSLAMSGVLDGLAINNLFDPGILTMEHAKQHVRKSLDLVIATALEDCSSRQ